jgi:squalene-associated FAD-dependent desaturase
VARRAARLIVANPGNAPVAVIGGGWAGSAAAVTLARLGHRVKLFEAATTLGGRARRVMRDGLPLDNGQHLMLGAYRQTVDLISCVHGDDAAAAMVSRRPLSLRPADPLQADAVTMQARAWPAPFGLVAGVAAARGLSLRERAGVIAWFARLRRNGFRTPRGQTVEQMLAGGGGRAAERLWKPLCLAALNTPPAQACAQTFANVLRVAFDARAHDSDLLLATTDLSALFPDAAAHYIEAHGGWIVTGIRAVAEAADAAGVILRTGDDRVSTRATVIAVGPHQLRAALDPGFALREPALSAALQAVDGLRYEPICTVWLGYAQAVALPGPMLRLDDAPGHWAFDRPDVLARAASPGPRLAQIVAVVLSAGGAHAALDHRTLAAQCDAQLRRLMPQLPACAWSQTIAERCATYACVPDRPRPASLRPLPRLFLAGDYMDAEFPATLEAAVRSGVAAACAVDEALAAQTRETL